MEPDTGCGLSGRGSAIYLLSRRKGPAGRPGALAMHGRREGHPMIRRLVSGSALILLSIAFQAGVMASAVWAIRRCEG